MSVSVCRWLWLRPFTSNNFSVNEKVKVVPTLVHAKRVFATEMFVYKCSMLSGLSRYGARCHHFLAAVGFSSSEKTMPIPKIIGEMLFVSMLCRCRHICDHNLRQLQMLSANWQKQLVPCLIDGDGFWLEILFGIICIAAGELNFHNEKKPVFDLLCSNANECVA